MSERLPEAYYQDAPEELEKAPERAIQFIAHIAKPFFDQGHERVISAVHCGRVYVGLELPQQCGTCGATEGLTALYILPDASSAHGIRWSSDSPS